MIRRLSFALFAVAGLILIAAASPALAKKGGGGRSAESTESTITLDTPAPSFASTVSFALTYPEMKWVPEVSVSCSVSGQLVYLVAQTPSGSGTWSPQFTLWSQSWAEAAGAPASCVANLYYYTWRGGVQTGVVYLAQTTFVTE